MIESQCSIFRAMFLINQPALPHQSSVCHGSQLQLQDYLVSWHPWSRSCWGTVLIRQEKAVALAPGPSKSSRKLLAMFSEVYYGSALLLHHCAHRDLHNRWTTGGVRQETRPDVSY